MDVSAAGPDTYRLDTRYLVGADGGKSFVREPVGIEFPGHTTTDGIARMGHAQVEG